MIDALGPQLSGIGRYTWELCRYLPKAAGMSDVRFFGRGRRIDDPQVLLRGDEPSRRRRLPNVLRDAMTRRDLRAGLVHGPNYFLPPQVESGIITVHDLSVFRYPETHPAARIVEFERQFASSLARARHVITDTETVRQEVIAYFSLREEQVTAVPLGVDAHYRPHSADELGPVLAALGLRSGGYALCVSTFEPRKKIVELLAAWQRLPKDVRNAVPLVLAGAAGWRNEALHQKIEAGVAAGWLKHLGFVPEASLPPLYAGATLFLYPSIYEGFGLPPVEAMASGVPVIVAERSCLPEVCGGCARFVDPDDAEGFSAAIAAALADETWRAQARASGLRRAAGYDWSRCAERTAGIYLANRG